MEPINRLLGLRLKEIRQNRKISQERLSEKLGVDPKYLSRIEVVKQPPHSIFWLRRQIYWVLRLNHFLNSLI